MKVVLYIGRNSSNCGACGRPADPREKSHDHILGYSPGAGCGATFTHMMSVYVYSDMKEIQKAMLDMRPDLEYIPIMDELPLEY
jgi:hypothetical protein